MRKVGDWPAKGIEMKIDANTGDPRAKHVIVIEAKTGKQVKFCTGIDTDKREITLIKLNSDGTVKEPVETYTESYTPGDYILRDSHSGA